MERENIKTLIVVCTYNEILNIKTFIPNLVNLYGDECDILLVDDNSPDGTGKWFDEYREGKKGFHHLSRNEKSGRGTASRAAYEFFSKSNYKYLIEIDCDYSHNPKDIRKMLDSQNENLPFLVGSRLMKGGGYGNYPFRRVFLSNSVIFLFRTLLNVPVKDVVQSFHMINRDVFKRINPSLLQANGFSVYAELKFLVHRAGIPIKEFPIVIQDREAGVSKLTFIDQFKSLITTLKHIWAIRMKKNDSLVEY